MNTFIDIKKRSVGNVDIFEFIWELDETNADKTFTAIYNTIWEWTNKKLIFNLSWLKYLNSKSIWYIADIFSNIEDNNWVMYLTNMTNEVKDTLELVGITTIISVSSTEEEALNEMWVQKEQVKEEPKEQSNNMWI